MDFAATKSASVVKEEERFEAAGTIRGRKSRALAPQTVSSALFLMATTGVCTFLTQRSAAKAIFQRRH